ncbi:unnamed protein product [Bursaphelenchus xylophilus]|uniref:(pine wood nematode) hypothetical protein n=1 Tax=Bursaphelenchus xylophilus TaxID=6326 RepID=A0A1I7SEG4_BURXY|nr:unnamed protein product [Bursaphelenchus xylophilus]CAG9103950.1 unnamed protein product [Bursaphelenchus xylophilus]
MARASLARRSPHSTVERNDSEQRRFQHKKLSQKSVNYRNYIHRIIKNTEAATNQRFAISSRGMETLNDLSMDLVIRMIRSASCLARDQSIQTLKETEIKAACGLIFKHELVQHSVNNINRAIRLYKTNV